MTLFSGSFIFGSYTVVVRVSKDMQMDVGLWLEIFSVFQPSKHVFKNKERGAARGFFHRKSLKTNSFDTEQL